MKKALGTIRVPRKSWIFLEIDLCMEGLEDQAVSGLCYRKPIVVAGAYKEALRLGTSATSRMSSSPSEALLRTQLKDGSPAPRLALTTPLG